MAAPELCVRVNYFGAVATLEGLRPLLAALGRAPRGRHRVVIGHEPHRPRRSSRRASRATRTRPSRPPPAPGCSATRPPSGRWRAGCGAMRRPTRGRAGGSGSTRWRPGVVQTPMTAPLLADEQMRPIVEDAVPMPYGGHAEPAHIAEVIAFLASADVQRVCGQVALHRRRRRRAHPRRGHLVARSRLEVSGSRRRSGRRRPASRRAGAGRWRWRLAAVADEAPRSRASWASASRAGAAVAPHLDGDGDPEAGGGLERVQRRAVELVDHRQHRAVGIGEPRHRARTPPRTRGRRGRR